MKAEQEAEFIDQKAGRIIISRELLGASFFFAAIATLVIIAIILANYSGYADSEATGAQIFSIICGLATATYLGLFVRKLLSKSLDELVRQKKSLIAQRHTN